MYELFLQKLKETAGFDETDLATIKKFFIPKKLRKKQYLLQEGDVCKFSAFVEKGALRLYSLDDKGGEHILQFAMEGWHIADLYSFLTGETSTYNIEAMEDCELVLITKQSHDELLDKMPKYERYMRLQITNAYLAMQRRLTSIISMPLDERYANLNKDYPHIVQRVPQHMIASYMGLTPETLSRVRRKIAEAKK
jgi:CRP-like cAMP-binding protein